MAKAEAKRAKATKPRRKSTAVAKAAARALLATRTVSAGRPSMLTPEVHDLMVEAAENGASNEQVAQAGGISYGTYYLWRARAMDAAQVAREGGEVDPIELPYLELIEAIMRVRSLALVKAGKRVMSCLDSDDESLQFRAAKFFLTTHDPEAWGGKTGAELRLAEAQAVKTEAEAVEAVGRVSALSRIAEDPGAMAALGRFMAQRLSGPVGDDDDGEEGDGEEGDE